MHGAGSQFIKSQFQFLSEKFPTEFKIDEYTHPIHGVCISVKFIRDDLLIDINNIEQISINVFDNCLEVITELPKRKIVYSKLIQDEMVW